MPQPPTTPFSGIFVSYRREDTAGHAGRLFDRLVSHFGRDRIFMDIDTIQPGEDFVTVVENAVSSCEILIAIIGRQWLSGTRDDPRALHNPNDFVRLEIGTALSRNIRVIPVLVQRANMPKPQDLPDDLSKLTRRHAVELTDLRWQTDVDQLISFLEGVLATERLKAEKERERREAEEKAEREAQEVSKRLAEAERVRKETEARQAEKEADRRRLEEEAQTRAAQELRRREIEEAERRRLEEEVQTRAAQELRRREIEEAEGRRLEEEAQTRAAQELRRREIEEAERIRSAGAHPVVIPGVDDPSRASDSPLMFRDATAPRENGSKKFVFFVILACVGLLGVIAVVWMMWSGPAPEVPSSNRNSIPTSTPASLEPPPGMVYVHGGEFTMGRDKADGGDPYEDPAHKVTVKPFFIDAHEVTCQEFQKYLQDHAVSGTELSQCSGRDGQRPVTGVTWDDANAYAAWAGKRLPTEEEWEFAARGADERRYPWGNEWGPGVANANKASDNLLNVGSFPAGKSPFGALDMVGNAWEWTASEMTAYPGGKLPKQEAKGTKVLRGGSYQSKMASATVTYRLPWRAREESDYGQTGFRCLKDAP